MTSFCAAGIDVGRDFFDVGIAPSGQVFRTVNGPKGVQAVVERLRREGVGRGLDQPGPESSRSA